MAILAAALVTAMLVFAARDEQQRRCVTEFIATYSDSNVARADAVEMESKAVRKAIRSGLSVRSREEASATLATYDAELAAVDAKRKANPPRALPEGICDL